VRGEELPEGGHGRSPGAGGCLMEETHSARVVFFEQALVGLQEALAKPEEPIVRDACIQRFEFTGPLIPTTKRAPRPSTRHRGVRGSAAAPPREPEGRQDPAGTRGGVICSCGLLWGPSPPPEVKHSLICRRAPAGCSGLRI
jgi:hypothetical protein